MISIPPERIAQIERRHADLAAQMGNPDLASDKFVALSKDYAELTPVAEAAREVRRLRDEALGARCDARRSRAARDGGGRGRGSG